MKFWGFVLITFVAFGSACKIGNAPGIQGSGNVKTDIRKLSGFKKIKAENAVDLDITVRKDSSVSVQADDNLIPSVTTEVNGDTLVIGLKDKVSTNSRIKISIAMPELSDMDLTGGTTGIVTGIKGDSLRVDATGAAKIKVDGQVDSLKAKATGASNIDAENLKANKADVESIGASTITVAADDLIAEANGASTVLYVGDPKSLKQNATDVSSIKKK